MGNITPSYTIVNPSYIMPEALMKINQVSGAFDTLPNSAPRVALSEGDLYVYLKAFDIRTKVAAGQVAYNQLPSVSIVAKMIQTPTYLIRVRAEYDHHDIAAGGNWGISIPEAQRLGMRQATFQTMRTGLLSGFNPANGEGLLNTNGATAVNLPADSNGNTTVSTYDNGQMALFFLSQIVAMKTRTFQNGLPSRITVLGPQRVLAGMEYSGVVQLTQFQRQGAGTASIVEMIKTMAAVNGDAIDWAFDDTLQGKGAGGTDAVILTIPDIGMPSTEGINTNAFAGLTPSLAGTNLQICDMAAPREIPTPLPGGAIDVLSELRITSGWGVRPEAMTILSMQFQ